MQMKCVLQGQMPVRGIQVGRHDAIADRSKLHGIVLDQGPPVVACRETKVKQWAQT